ncbi:energy transducer TonB [Echinicola strongylocentroti]|uniref:Energy transducer TonB n=1 Tax=Echinicola strongylocentroti TaxID=1795355 RepID=A0A2Z4IEN4_9BACT|nr:energy transducer TonB [Echinicola strongylocentroti]AWW29394.1 energy transducer TonB [Echinicola strongylocentroti]
MEAKKTPKADLSKKSGMFLNLGLLVSVGLTLFAFEYKTYESGELMDLGTVEDDFEELLDIPITEQPPPPPPPVEQPIIEEIPDEVEIEEKIEVNFDVEVQEETVIKEVVIEDAPVQEKAEEIFDVVETMPTPPGGMEGWNKYLSKNLKYPTQARRMGIEGTVYVVFVVNTDGSIQDVGILRGIGGGCDEEAMRVVRNAPNWQPGKQRGRPVRVKMRLPIRFKLS